MSIIRQRSKNLLFSGFIGFVSACLIITLIYVFGIRGNIKVIEWILNDSQLEVMTMSEPIETEVIERQEVIRVIRSINKDTIITSDMLETIEIDKGLEPTNYIASSDAIVGKKAKTDIDGNVIISAVMVEDPNVYEVSLETVEVQGVHYPDILAIGQYVNMRIHYPTGQDYTILENKNVVHIDTENKSFFINLTDEEILSYSSAIEDKNIYPGTQIYLTIEGRGSIVLDESSEKITSLYKKGLQYEVYPLNPNALALSQVNNFDTELLDARVVLDLSLKEFFDLNSERFSYELEVEESDLSEDSGDIGLEVDIDDEATALQAASPLNDESGNQVGSETSTNESSISDNGEESNSSNSDSSNSLTGNEASDNDETSDTDNDDQPDFDF